MNIAMTYLMTSSMTGTGIKLLEWVCYCLLASRITNNICTADTLHQRLKHARLESEQQQDHYDEFCERLGPEAVQHRDRLIEEWNDDPKKSDPYTCKADCELSPL
jgi:hypothetical protein